MGTARGESRNRAPPRHRRSRAGTAAEARPSAKSVPTACGRWRIEVRDGRADDEPVMPMLGNIDTGVGLTPRPAPSPRGEEELAATRRHVYAGHPAHSAHISRIHGHARHSPAVLRRGQPRRGSPGPPLPRTRTPLDTFPPKAKRPSLYTQRSRTRSASRCYHCETKSRAGGSRRAASAMFPTLCVQHSLTAGYFLS